MFPVEVMAFAERTGGAAGGEQDIEEAVADVDCPGSQGEEDGKPSRQLDVCGVGEGQCPDYGDCRGVEAGQVPEAQKTGRLELA